MRRDGVAVERRMLNDRYTVKYYGWRVIMDVTDQGLRRPVKVARLKRPGINGHEIELLDPHIVWTNEGKFTLAGFERVNNEEGKAVEFAQSWLCALDFRPPEELDESRNVRPMR